MESIRMAGTDSQDVRGHVLYQEYAQLAPREEWDSRDGQQREGTSTLQSTRHRTQSPYHGHSDEHEDGLQESPDG